MESVISRKQEFSLDRVCETGGFQINYSKVDPDQSVVKKNFVAHYDEILRFVEKSKNLIDGHFSTTDVPVFTLFYKNEKLGFTVQIDVTSIADGEYFVGFEAFSSRWAEERVSMRAQLFPESAKIDGSDEFKSTFALDYISEKIGVTAPIKDFSVKSAYGETEKVIDTAGKGIDSNIVELVRYINALGISTDASCGGHKDGKLPYLYFDYPEDACRIGKTLEMVTGHKWNIVPLGDRMEVFKLAPPKGMSVKQAQSDFDRLTDFFAKSVKISVRALTATEIGHKFRRRIAGAFRGN